MITIPKCPMCGRDTDEKWDRGEINIYSGVNNIIYAIQLSHTHMRNIYFCSHENPYCRTLFSDDGKIYYIRHANFGSPNYRDSNITPGIILNLQYL